MNNSMIHVTIEPPFAGQVDPDLLRAAARAALQLASSAAPGDERTEMDVLEMNSVEMTIVVTGDEQIQALNRQFLGLDAPTDVLSFPAEGEVEPRSLEVTDNLEGTDHLADDLEVTGTAEGAGHLVDLDEELAGAPARYLGDIILSYPRALEQAGDHHPVAAELQLLTVHGTLHLLGYDHATPEEQARMWNLQSQALQALGAAITEPHA